MSINFRTLEAHEIDCKATIVNNKVEIVLHSKAATCTKLLNEIVGPMNWEKEYTNGNKNCIVRIWDKDKKMWVSKEDCGGPLTDIDGHKGQASNGFKRVCALGWGLGIELYSQPEIRINATDENTVYDSKYGMLVNETYSVSEIEYDKDRNITHCVIVDSKKNVVYDGPNEFGESNAVPEIPKAEVVIPENADMLNDESQEEKEEMVEAIAQDVEEEIPDELPDNTDGYSEVEAFAENVPPFSPINYKAAFESEISRTHTKKDDVLKVLNIKSFDDIDTVPNELLVNTLEKLKSRKTYAK